MNEILLVAQLVVFYSLVVIIYNVFGSVGLLSWTVMATIAANIEVLVQINAFGMNMTLGNILFASTFVVTDILSEVEGKKSANLAVNIGIATSVVFLIVSQSWLLFNPNSEDFAMPHLRAIFSNTPRLLLVSLLVYALVQRIDVQLYHLIWRFTERLSGDSKRLLWLRNNLATLIPQLLNAVLYTFGAFYGVFETGSLWGIIGSSYIIFIVTSIADTPVVYICRWLKEKRGALTCRK